MSQLEQRIRHQTGHSSTKRTLATPSDTPVVPQVSPSVADYVQAETKLRKIPEECFSEGHSLLKTLCPDCGCFTSRRGEDGRCFRCTWPEESDRADRLTRLKAIARAHAQMVLNILSHSTRAWDLYTDDDVAGFARLCYRACLKHQLEGGQPSD